MYSNLNRLLKSGDEWEVQIVRSISSANYLDLTISDESGIIASLSGATLPYVLAEADEMATELLDERRL